MNVFVICLVAVTVVVSGSPISSSGYGGVSQSYSGNNNYPQQQHQQASPQHPAASNSHSNQDTYAPQNNYGKYEQQPTYGQQNTYGSHDSTTGYPQAQLYHGRYSGSCKEDGIYYNDIRSIVFCTNGIAYVQQCAPGTTNSEASLYSTGSDTASFCNVNLVDKAGASHDTDNSNSHDNDVAKGNNHAAPSSSYGNNENNNYAAPSYQRPSYQPIHPQQQAPAYSQSYSNHNNNGHTHGGSGY